MRGAICFRHSLVRVMRVIRSPLIFFIEQQEQITWSSSLRRAIWSERANSKLCKFFNLWELNLKKYILSAAVILFSKRQKSAKSLHSEVLYIRVHHICFFSNTKNRNSSYGSQSKTWNLNFYFIFLALSLRCSGGQKVHI